LRATAFTAADAHAINVRLLDLGEALVNQINTRGRSDLIKYAQSEVDQAEARAKDAAAALAAFRNQRAVFDPERQSTLQLQSATKLQEELSTARGQLAQVQAAAPQNPQLPALRLRVQQIEADAGAANARVTGGSGSLTSKAADFERLALERSFADRQLAGALSALETARNDARRQQLYLERVVQANLPDLAMEPRRLRNVAATLVAGLLMWGVLSLLLAAVREHRH
jgi:capsular polysaccharide transport system permease protein